MMANCRSIVLLAVIAACTDLPSTIHTTVSPAAFRLAATDVWSGGELQVFSGTPLQNTLPTVTLGGQVATVIRLNDSTLVVSLPPTVGPLAVVVAGEQGTLRVTVTLHGYDMRGAFYGLWGVLQQLPGAPAVVIGNGATGLVRADLRTGNLAPYPDSIHSSTCGWGPGVTSVAGEVILEVPGPSSSPCLNSSWLVAPALARRETTPSFPVVESEGNRVLAELAPGRWLSSEEYDFTLWVCDTGCVNTYAANAPAPPTVPGRIDGVHVSPQGNQATVDLYYAQGAVGVPVIDAHTARVAYWKPSMAWSEGAAFSPGGDTLFMAGGDSVSGGAAWMFALRASDGAVLDSVPLAVQPGDLALDPGGRWIYISGVSHTNYGAYWSVGARLEVLDRATLHPVASMRSDSISVSVSVWDKHRLVLDTANHEVYVVTTDIYLVPGAAPTNAIARVFRFSTPP